MWGPNSEVVGFRVEVVEPEGDVAVSEKGLEPAYQFVQETYGFEDCHQALEVYVVEEARYIEQEHAADHVIRVGRVVVVLEGEARVYCRRGVSASELSDGDQLVFVCLEK